MTEVPPTEIPTLPFKPETSRFGRIFSASRFHSIFSWIGGNLLSQRENVVLCSASLFNEILCHFCGCLAFFHLFEPVVILGTVMP